jgi:hypothetical protein
MPFAVLSRLAAAATIVLAGALSVGAQTLETPSRPVAVVEVFTSQGCSSCPPADQIVADLGTRRDVIALSYHVDYWDYRGWRDTLATAENSARQYDYAKALGLRSVYTPQAIINGTRQVNGAKRKAVEAGIDGAARTGALAISVAIHRTGDTIVIETDGGSPDEGRTRPEAHVMIVYFDAPTSIEIPKGENGGRTLTYHRAVRAYHSAGIWTGTAARFEMPASEMMKKATGGCAAIVQQVAEDGRPGAIIGAAMLEWNEGS